jgi:hypothetical protein
MDTYPNLRLFRPTFLCALRLFRRLLKEDSPQRRSICVLCMCIVNFYFFLLFKFSIFLFPFSFSHFLFPISIFRFRSLFFFFFFFLFVLFCFFNTYISHSVLCILDIIFLQLFLSVRISSTSKV